MAEDDRDRQADALRRMTGGGDDAPKPPPPPPASAAMFRAPRPAEPAAADAPDARPKRPAAPPSRAESQTPAGDAAAQRLASVSSNESDTVPVYVPRDADSTLSPATSPASVSSARALERERTFIPILLNCGTLLFMVGAARWLVPEDSAFRILSAATSLAILAFGVVLLAVAVLNMLQVRDRLAAPTPQTEPARRG